MQQDKAIIKAFKEDAHFSLPPSFNERAMFRIYKEAERKKKQSFILMLSSIITASLGLIAMAYYLLKTYISFNVALHFRLPTLKVGTLSQYYFYIYIAILILFLMFFDYLFRGFWNKRKYEKNISL